MNVLNALHLDDDPFASLPEKAKPAKPYNPPPAWRCSPPVERARHLFGLFYAHAAAEHCQNEGISEEETRLGAVLAEQDKADFRLRRSVYGDPAYGSHPSHAAGTKARCVQCGGRRARKSELDPPDLADCACEVSQYKDGV